MPEQPAHQRNVLGLFVGALAKIVIVVVIISTIVGLIFYGGVSPDQHGIRNIRENKPLVGAWLGEWPSDTNNAVRKFEDQTGVRLDIVDVFVDWYTPGANVTHAVRHIAGQGSVAMITWEPHGYTTVDIVDGKKVVPQRGGQALPIDRYIDQFADAMCDIQRETGQPLMMRVMHEMNGNWYSWGITYERDGQRVNSDETFKQAWRKIHDAFERHCSQTMWVWALNHFSVGQGATFLGPYPGDAYVDFVGIDGYNWGDHAEWGWQSFDILFSEVYCEVRAEIPTKKMLIAETATTEKGGDKDQWIGDLFGKIAYQDYPGVAGFVYFNFAKYEVEIEGNMDWPVGSSPEAIEAFRAGGDLLERARNGDKLPPRPLNEFGEPVSSGPRC